MAFVWGLEGWFGLFFLNFPLVFLFSYQELGKPNVLTSLVPTRPGFGQCCFAADAMPRVTQLQMRAFFKAELLWG